MTPEREVTVRCVAIDAADPTVLIVGLAEEEDCSGDSLILQGIRDPRSPAGGLGNNALSNGAGATCYDGVASWSISDSILEIHPTPEAARALGIDRVVQVSLSVNDETIASVRDALILILGPPIDA